MFRITNEWLVNYRTEGGGYNKKQLNALGIEWPPTVGWKTSLVGKDVPIAKAKEFENLANKSKPQEKQWEDDEILQLLKRIQKNMSIDVIANKHGRTVEEINAEIRQIARDYWFNDERPIEEIKKYTRLTKEEIEAIIAKEQSDLYMPDYYVYTDGACSNNGTVRAKAGLGIFFGIDDPRNVSKQVEGKQTNNTAELGAILLVFKILENDIIAGKKIMIVSDSTYAIKSCTTYGAKCAQQNWSKDLPNKEMVKQGYELAKKFPNVQFMHVLGHTGKEDEHSVGNHYADMLANAAIGLIECPYG